MFTNIHNVATRMLVKFKQTNISITIVKEMKLKSGLRRYKPSSNKQTNVTLNFL